MYGGRPGPAAWTLRAEAGVINTLIQLEMSRTTRCWRT